MPVRVCDTIHLSIEQQNGVIWTNNCIAVEIAPYSKLYTLGCFLNLFVYS